MSLPVIFDGSSINTSLEVYEYIVSKRNISITNEQIVDPSIFRTFIPDLSDLDFTLQYAQSIGKESEFLADRWGFTQVHYQEINRQAVSLAASDPSAAEARDYIFNFVLNERHDSFGELDSKKDFFAAIAQADLANILNELGNPGQPKTIEILNSIMLDSLIKNPIGYEVFRDGYYGRVAGYGFAIVGAEASDFWHDLLDGSIGDELPKVAGMFSNANLLNFEGVSFELNIDLSSGLLNGSGAANTIDILGAKSVIGSSNVDVITGSTDQNLIEAREGDDTVFGSLGNDTLDGGAHTQDGGDLLTYEKLQGVELTYEVLTPAGNGQPTVYQATKAFGPGLTETDTFQSFEKLRLSPGADLIKLDSLPSDIDGMEFDAGENQGAREFSIQHYAGNTVTTVLADMDFISLEGLAVTAGQTGAFVDLFSGQQGQEMRVGSVAFGNISIITNNFEGVLGTDGDDTFWGNEVNNALLGFTGNDILVGREGQDLLVGDAGDDRLYGGTWTDPGDELAYADDGIRDLLLGGADNDSYYVSNNDQVWDMTLEQMATAVPGGRPSQKIARQVNQKMANKARFREVSSWRSSRGRFAFVASYGAWSSGGRGSW